MAFLFQVWNKLWAERIQKMVKAEDWWKWFVSSLRKRNRMDKLIFVCQTSWFALACPWWRSQLVQPTASETNTLLLACAMCLSRFSSTLSPFLQAKLIASLKSTSLKIGFCNCYAVFAAPSAPACSTKPYAMNMEFVGIVGAYFQILSDVFLQIYGIDRKWC